MATETPSIALYALTEQGAHLAGSLQSELNATLYLPERLARENDCATPFASLLPLVEQTFSTYNAHVFIAATGIVVRAIAPHLVHKTNDPAVVVLDQNGTHAISLLSGHLGGANDLARRVASITGGTPVITTATDCAGAPAIDLIAQRNNMPIARPASIKHVNSALAHGTHVALFDPENRLELLANEQAHFEYVAAPSHDNEPCVLVHWKTRTLPETTLTLHPPVLVAGIGCRKNTPAKDILHHVRTIFAQNNLALESLAHIVSTDLKQNEPGLLAAARTLRAPVTFYTNQELGQIQTPNPSQRVEKHIGVPSVCEAAALKMTQSTRLLIPKKAHKNVTLAVALLAQP